MKSMRLDDLCSVDIQWKMLTSLRPKTKLDEEYYTKYVYFNILLHNESFKKFLLNNILF